MDFMMQNQNVSLSPFFSTSRKYIHGPFELKQKKKVRCLFILLAFFVNIVYISYTYVELQEQLYLK